MHSNAAVQCVWTVSATREMMMCYLDQQLGWVMIPVNHNGLFLPPQGPTEQEPNDLWDQMRHLTLKPPVLDHTNTHRSKVQLETYVHGNTIESLNHEGSEYLDADILHLCYSLLLFKLHNSNTHLCLTIWQPTGPTSCSWNHQHHWWAEVCNAS